MRSSRRALALAAVAALAGCAGVGKIKAHPLDVADQQVVLDATFERAQGAVRAALVKTGFSVAEETAVAPGTWYAIGDMGAAMQSWGQFARVTLHERSADVTLAVFLSVRKIDSNVSEDLEGVRRKLTMNI